MARFPVANGVESRSGTAVATGTAPSGLVPALTHTVSDANYTVTTADRLVSISSLTATRVLTLPSAGLTAPQQLVIVDETGMADWYPVLLIGPVNGGMAAVLKDAWGSITLTWTGTQWSTSGWCATAKPAVITGTTYYVSAAGSDAANGTSISTPWLTIGKANARALSPGDGILFRGGDSFTDTFLTIAASTAGTVAAPVVFGSYGTGQASLTKGVFIIGNTGASTSPNLVFDNLHFASTAAGNQGVQIGNGSHPCNNTIFQRCVFSDTSDTTTTSTGLYLTGNDHLVTGNYFHDWPNNAIQMGVAAGDSDGITITQNLAYRIGLNLSMGFNPHTIYGLASNVTCCDNVFTSAPSWTSCISMREHNWFTCRNHVAGCNGGIDYFEYDTTVGQVTVEDNKVLGATSYGVFIASADDGLGDTQVIQSVAIKRNHFEMTAGNAGKALSLWSAFGGYDLEGNTGMHGTALETDEVLSGVARPRYVQSVAYSSSVTPSLPQNADLVLNIGTLTGVINVRAPAGSPSDGQLLTLRFVYDGTGGYAVTFGSGANGFLFGTDVTLALVPSAASSKWEMLFQWSALDAKWRAKAIVRGF